MNGFRHEIQHGSPLHVGDREIVPEAEVWSLQMKQMTLADHQASGGGVLLTWARPTALIDRNQTAERRWPVADINLQLEIALLIAAIVLPILLTIFTAWARRSPSID